MAVSDIYTVVGDTRFGPIRGEILTLKKTLRLRQKKNLPKT